jgi:hypothetical protein
MPCMEQVERESKVKIKVGVLTFAKQWSENKKKLIGKG